MIRPLVILAAGVMACAAEVPSEWAALSQNPMADVMRLPVQNRFDQGVGYKDNTQYNLIFKPTMASDVAENWIMINRFDVPLIYRPGIEPGAPDDHGLADIQYESLYGPSGWRRFYWGVGPLFEIPSATDSGLGSKKWSAGLGGTAAWVGDSFVIGAGANHLVSFAGAGPEQVERSTIAYWAYWNFPRGWWIGTSPNNIADWQLPTDQVWTVPVGGGFGKVFVNGRYPINVKLEAYTFVEPPPTGAEWSLLFEVEWLFTAKHLFKQ